LAIFANTPRNGYVPNIPNLGKYEQMQTGTHLFVICARQMSLSHQQKSGQKLQAPPVFIIEATNTLTNGYMPNIPNLGKYEQMQTGTHLFVEATNTLTNGYVPNIPNLGKYEQMQTDTHLFVIQ
jgi:hypothetical protein